MSSLLVRHEGLGIANSPSETAESLPRSDELDTIPSLHSTKTGEAQYVTQTPVAPQLSSGDELLLQ